MVKRIYKAGAIMGSLLGLGWGFYNGNDFIFPPTVKLICFGSRLFSDTKIKMGELKGSIREGRVTIRNAKISYKGNDKDVDLSINSLEVIYGKDMLPLLFNLQESLKDELEFDKFYLRGVKGSVNLKGKGSPLPSFKVKDFYVEDVQLNLKDHRWTPEPFAFPPLAIYRLSVHNLRSKSFLADIHETGNMLGSMGAGVIGLDKVVNTEDLKAQNLTVFRAMNIPLGHFHPLLSEPLSWFTKANCDLTVVDSFHPELYRLTVHVTINDIVINPAASTVAKLAHPFASKYFLPKDSTIEFSFPLVVSKEDGPDAIPIPPLIMAHIITQAKEKLGSRWEDFKRDIKSFLPSIE